MDTGLEQAGDRLGRYIIERRIAVGGMAELFLARLDGPENFSKRVVIKRILPRLRGNHQFARMFSDEARLAARFSHPNLVQVFELAEYDDVPVMVMEYVDGKDLGALLKRSHRDRVLIPIRIAAYVIGQIAQGLHAAHELTGRSGRPLNVIHRDVSPENVLVTRMGGVKVIDFGIAKHEARSAETVVGTVKGKVAYMSPEQLLRKHLDRRADVFSLGVVFYELLTGEQCFQGDSAMQQMMAVEKAQYKPVHSIRPKVPPDVEAVVDRMLALRPQDRFQTAREVVVAIERLMSKYGTVLSNDLEEYVAPMFEPEEAEVRRPTWESRVEDERWESDVFEHPGGQEYAPPLADEITVAGEEALDPDRTREEPQPEPQPWPEAPPDPQLEAFERPVSPPKRRGGGQRLAALALAALLVLGVAFVRWFWIGQVEVRTIPPGATVTLNGEAIGPSPLEVSFLRPGVIYELGVELGGFERQERELIIDRSDPATVKLIRLDSAAPPGAGVVTVTSDPPGAKIQIEGRKEYYVSPARFVLPAKRVHRLTADLEGYSQAKLEVELEDGERASRRLVLIASFARLSLLSKPRVEVFLDGESLGETPLESVKLPAGESTLVLVNESLGIRKEVRVDLPPGSSREADLTLEKGELFFEAKPWADVYVDGRKVGTTPMLPLKVFEGSHEVRFVNPSMKKDTKVEVVVNAGDSTRVSAGWDRQ